MFGSVQDSDDDAPLVGSLVAFPVLLARGPRDEVWSGRPWGSRDDVAVKVFTDPPRLEPILGPALAFRAEHPSLVRVRDAGRLGMGAYVITDLLHGRTLEAALRDCPFDAKGAFRLLAPIADGLAALHAKDLAHGDVRPGTIFCCADGPTRLLGFGVGRTTAQFRAPELGPRDATTAGDVYALARVVALASGTHRALVEEHLAPWLERDPAARRSSRDLARRLARA